MEAPVMKQRPLPRGAGIVAAVLLLVLADRLVAFWDNPYFTQVLVLVGINVVLAVSLNLINGFTGQLSIGHAGFMAIGAYLAAAISVYAGTPILAFFSHTMGFPGFVGRFGFFALLLMAGGLAAAFCGLLVGIPILRLRGDYLAIATLGFGEIVRIIILNIEAVGGARGFSVVSADPAFDVRYEGIFAIYAVVILTVVAIARLAHSGRGRAYLAVRDDEVATESLGVSAARVKTEAFVVAAFFGGVAGVLFSQSQGYVHTNSFTFMRSIEVILFVVLGGMGSITGSIIAATILTLAPELLRAASEYRMIAFSLVLVVIMIWRPQGLLGMRELRWRDLRRLWDGGRPTAGGAQ